MPTDIINAKAIQPLYKPWGMPDQHRLQGGVIKDGRRPSGIVVAQNLRAALREWREGVAGAGQYAGVSDTTLELLNHWFQRDHFITSKDGSTYPFRYHFCQREAIESLIYLLEVRQINRLTSLVSEFGGPDAETAALGVNPEQDQWGKFAFKMATGSGKTKVMSLAIVWSYFHALRESDSPMTRHFIAVAPNITVFERLKDDFAPVDGGPNIFDSDPLIPTHWRSDWNFSVVLQDESSGAATGGTLYLTNIHRLYDTSKRKGKEAETYDWAGPSVSKAKALETGAELRERVTSHKRVMVLNDEAHHVWDPDSAFFVRSRSGDCYLVETKGREDKDVPAKARTAVAWCKAASGKSLKWTYVYVPQGVYERSSCNELKELVALCKPALQELLTEDVVIQPSLFAKQDETSELRVDEFVAVGDFEALPPAYQQSIRHAVTLFRFTEQKEGLPFSPAFNPLMGSLEKSSTALLVERLTPYVPSPKAEQKDFFEPELTGIEPKTAKRYQDEFRKLERTLVYRTPVSPMGHLRFALEIGLKETHKAPIFEALRKGFGGTSAKDLFDILQSVYNFRNKYIAHQEFETITKELARQQLKQWIVCLTLLNKGRSSSSAIK